MPTARELLEQADALMKRNRKRGKSQFGDIPTLTDALGADRDGTLAPTVILPDAQPAAVDPIVLDARAADQHGGASAVGGSDAGARISYDPRATDPIDPISLDTLGDVPILTDAVLDWSDASLAAVDAEPAAAGNASDHAFPVSAEEAEIAAAGLPPPAVLEQDAAQSAPSPPETPAAVQGEAVAVARATPPPDDEFILEIPPATEGTKLPPGDAVAVPESPIPAIPEPPTAPREPYVVAPETLAAEALAEEIRMQVLQRLDLFTDTGLRAQLAERLRPIVDRASADLIETINRELGVLVRAYVAEAIEREIESWRNRASHDTR